jgi:nitrogen regulatory protein PII
VAEGKMAEKNIKFDLIVTIVNKGFATDVVDVSRKAGAEGGTIVPGRGTGIHEDSKIFGIPIEPEKEIVLTLINQKKTETVLQAIEKELSLDDPGKGIAFVLDVRKVAGICHLCNSGKEK